MSKLGDVVFCVDCDRGARAREGAGAGALTGVVAGALGGSLHGSVNGDAAAPPSPRRMAVKKDANGDRLCAQCLDARRSNRNAAFLLQERRAQFSSEEAVGSNGAQSSEAPARPRILRIASAVRITRHAVAEQAPVAGTIAGTDMRSVAAPRAQRAARRTEPAAIRTRGANLERTIELERPIKPAHKREPVAKSRARERAFVQLAAEIGFVRTRLLLDKLKKNLRATR